MPSLQRAIAFRWGIISQPDAGGASGAVGGRMVALCCGDGSHQASFLEQFSGLTMPPLCGPDANPNPNPNQGPDGTEGELAGGPSVRLWSHGCCEPGQCLHAWAAAAPGVARAAPSTKLRGLDRGLGEILGDSRRLDEIRGPDGERPLGALLYYPLTLL
jgi:hypothetical protein